jgi:hypothetical protein
MDHTTQTLLVEALLGSAVFLWAVTWVSSMLGQGRQRKAEPPQQAE